MTDEEYRDKAREQYSKDGEIEIDGDAEVSRAHDHVPDAPCHHLDDDGAYVQAWVWVTSQEEAPEGADNPTEGIRQLLQATRLLAAVDALIDWDAATPSYDPEALDPLSGLIGDLQEARQPKGRIDTWK